MKQSPLRAMLASMVVSCLIAMLAVAPAVAQGQPKSVNPTASSVTEQQLLEALKPTTGTTTAVSGRVTIPDQASRNLIQPGGRDWRELHQQTMPRVGTIAILGMLALVAVFFLVRGRIRLSEGFSGRMVTRFGGIERFAHWLAAVSFILLGLSGLNLTFGKSIVLPIVGPEAFTSLSQFGKLVHNYVSFAFVLGIVLMFLFWVKDNFPHPRDLLWIVQGGGLIGGLHPRAGRFNFGQKLIFWSTILGGAGLAVTGYIMMFPFRFADLGGMQLATIIHGLIGVVLVAIIIGHIYIGTLGMEGAFGAMGSGKVDENWAREHHAIWAEKELGAPGGGSGKGSKPMPAE